MENDNKIRMIKDAQVYLSGTYINLYLQHLNCKKNGKNIECPEKENHPSGTDKNPSCSVDNTTGMYYCHTCGIRGNFIKFYNDYIKPKEGGKHIVEWIEENLPGITKERYSNIESYRQHDEAFKELLNNIEQKRDSYNASMQKNAEIIQGGEDYIHRCMRTLLEDGDSLEYLKQTRYINPQLIEQFQLGLDVDTGAFIIPIRDKDGQLVNIKKYNPRSLDSNKKWSYEVRDKQNFPNPYSVTNNNTLVIFEGELDMYCAQAHGIYSAVTFGSASADVLGILGHDAEEFLRNDIYIVYDADETGQKNATKLAEQLYEYADQVKIIDLNYSKSNPFGLDYKLTDENGKRVEKDFTDFMKKNGFGENALEKFNELLEKSEVYYKKDSLRTDEKDIKISLSEAKKGVKYYNSFGNIILRLTAEIEERINTTYKYDRELNIMCPKMNPNDDFKSNMCNNCILKEVIDSRDSSDYIEGLDITLKTFGDKDEGLENNDIFVQPSYIFDLAKTPLEKYEAKRRGLLGIPNNCKHCTINVKSIFNLIEITLKTTTESFNEDSEYGSNTYDYKAFILDKTNNIELEAGRTYNFTGYIAYEPTNAFSVFFAYDYYEVMNTHERFFMTPETHNILKSRFQPAGWNIDDINSELNYRYSIYQDAMGIVGREDMVFGTELSITSILNIDYEGLPAVHRGWVEMGVIGDSRTGKSIIIRWFDTHFGSNSYYTCTTMTRAGLLSGVENGKIKFGLLAKKHRGMMFFDEASHLPTYIYTEMNPVRSEGIIQSVQIKSGTTWGKVRKVFVANPRGDDQLGEDLSTFSRKNTIPEFFDLFGSAPAIQRFDIGMRLFSDDVDTENLKNVYRPIIDKYTSYECNLLKQFAWTRNAKSHVKFEEGFEDKLNECANQLNTKYHENTQLVSIEIKTKLVRLAQSLAVLLYSVEDSDYNVVIVRTVFLEYITKWLMHIYDGRNMQLDVASKKMWDAETLGEKVNYITDMIDEKTANILLQHKTFDVRNLYIWLDSYLDSVLRGEKYVYESSKDTFSTGGKKEHTMNKVLDFLCRENCLSINGNKAFLTKPFVNWLEKRMESPDEFNNGTLDVMGNTSELNGGIHDKINRAKKDQK